jgi:hypothetical protein
MRVFYINIYISLNDKPANLKKSYINIEAVKSVKSNSSLSHCFIQYSKEKKGYAQPKAGPSFFHPVDLLLVSTRAQKIINLPPTALTVKQNNTKL